MVIEGLWLAIILFVITIEIYLLSKYISNKNGVFLDNIYASFVNGILIYLFITFITFLPFIWINVNILYLVIIFLIKEGITFVFLLTRDQDYINFNQIKNYLIIILGAILITFLWNYGLSQLIKPTEEVKTSDFVIIFNLNEILERISSVGISAVKNWGTTFIVSLLGINSILCLISEYSLSMNFSKKLMGFIMTILSIILFSYKLPLWQNGEIFISVFVLVVASRLIQYSRRRYGFIFVIASVASFTLGQHLRLALWGIAIVTMVVYTFMKKPQNSLFWVILVSPLLIIESFNIYKISIILSLVLVGLSIFMFTFMLSLQGVKPMKKLNEFFEKYRVFIPFVIGIAIMGSAIAIAITNDINWKSLPTINNSIIYPIETTSAYKWFNFSIYCIAFFGLTTYIFIKIFKFIPLKRIDFIYMISWLMLITIYNPLVDSMLSTSVFYENTKFVSSVIFLPTSILFVKESIEYIKQK